MRNWLMVLLVCLAPGLSAAESIGDPLAIPRGQFLEAREALFDGDLNHFRALADRLRDYPLYPYLRYSYLYRHLDDAGADAIRDFIGQYGDTPLADQLHRAWLEHLAQGRKWSAFLSAYSDRVADGHLRCMHVQARRDSGESGNSLWPDVRALWLVGYSQDKACDPVFAAYVHSGALDHDTVVARITLAMEQGRGGLAHYLARFLPPGERDWVERWRRMYRDPERELARLQGGRGDWPARLYVFGIRRLADEDAARAWALWQSRADFSLDPTQIHDTEGLIALHWALQHLPGAPQRLAQVQGDDPVLGQWAVRAALWEQDWPAVMAAIDRLPPARQGQSNWLYWRARAVEALHQPQQAVALYKRAAGCRCYYGFLAAERLGESYKLADAPLVVSAQALATVATKPGILRARELYRAGLTLYARREWRDGLARMDATLLPAAAVLADSWGWNNQAILSLAQCDEDDDLSVRFPTPFSEQVTAAAQDRALDAAFIYAVMRQESAFYAKARSPAGALGLMQLMPHTARQTGRLIHSRVRGNGELLSADRNIELGSAHLRQLLDEYGGNRLFTMVAYNAGPRRLSQWRPRDRIVPADIWVATLPSPETRGYVRRVAAYLLIYQWRLGKPMQPLTSYMADVGPPAAADLAMGAGK